MAATFRSIKGGGGGGGGGWISTTAFQYSWSHADLTHAMKFAVQTIILDCHHRALYEINCSIVTKLNP